MRKNIKAKAICRNQWLLYGIGQEVMAKPLRTWRGVYAYRLMRFDTGREIGVISIAQFKSHFEEI